MTDRRVDKIAEAIKETTASILEVYEKERECVVEQTFEKAAAMVRLREELFHGLPLMWEEYKKEHRLQIASDITRD